MTPVSPYCILGLVFWSLGWAWAEEEQYSLDLSACQYDRVDIYNKSASFTVTGQSSNSTSTFHKPGKLCTVKIRFYLTRVEEGVEVHFSNSSQFREDLNVTMFYVDDKSGSHTGIFPTDSVSSITSPPLCLTTSNGHILLGISYYLTQVAFEEQGFFKAVVCSRNNSSKSADVMAQPPVIVLQQDDLSPGTLEGPKMGTSSVNHAGRPSAKPPLDVIIITGVTIAAIIGMVVAGVAVRRWIRSNAAEERRLSQIRVNSRDGHPRSSSSARSLSDRSEGGPNPIAQYGSVRIGGRLPSSEDESDLFSDSKSTKTYCEEL